MKPQDDLATSGLGTRNNRRGGPLNQTKQNRVVPLSPHQNCIVFGRCGIWRLACLKTVPMPGNFRVQQLKATQMRLKGVRGKKLFVHVSCRVICARLHWVVCIAIDYSRGRVARNFEMGFTLLVLQRLSKRDLYTRSALAQPLPICSDLDDT